MVVTIGWENIFISIFQKKVFLKKIYLFYFKLFFMIFYRADVKNKFF
jgi:hypothetical protein